jgi:hypothetical protein
VSAPVFAACTSEALTLTPSPRPSTLIGSDDGIREQTPGSTVTDALSANASAVMSGGGGLGGDGGGKGLGGGLGGDGGGDGGGGGLGGDGGGDGGGGGLGGAFTTTVDCRLTKEDIVRPPSKVAL